jgi:diguanylate cyclase (GGDEF)-like protein/PAS domain S-box-containing protein
VVDWNQAAEDIFGYTKEEMQEPHATEKILPLEAREAVDEVWGSLLKNKGGSRSRNENCTKEGKTILCEWYNTPLAGPDGKVFGVASLVDDITERKLSEEMIWKQANFDMLTGLPNRNMFHDRLEQEMIKTERDKHSLALLLIDLDQFKEVNDALGHDVGDLLLKEAGRRISDCVRHSDTVARLGGDEFIIILPELHDDYNIEDVAQNIISKLEKEYHLGDEIIHISGSIGITLYPDDASDIGITLYPDDASDIDSLLKNADQAMYAAKKKGRHCFSYFTQSLQDAAQNRLRLTRDLRSAHNNKQFEVYFQPIIDLKTDHIIKAEALLRWHHPDRGLVSPMEFIHLAEDTGLINKIGDWVFKQSVQNANHWNNMLACDFQVSVNTSPIQFKQDTDFFITEWQAYLHEHEISGKNIVVEITEGLLLNAEPEVIDKLLWLRDAGIQVAIDDFGTGYSSLSYLKKFDIDYLKIDKSFINNLENNANDITLCDAIIVMAHTMGLKVIAEGVETKGQKKILTDAGCDFAQGYLFSEPVPSNEFETMLKAEQTNS